jgi:hypothetical protein
VLFRGAEAPDRYELVDAREKDIDGTVRSGVS